MKGKTIFAIAAVLLSVGLVAGCLGGSGLVGKWNITKVEASGTIEGQDMSFSTTMDGVWFEFKDDGTITGGGSTGELDMDMPSSGTWEETEDGKVTITSDGESITFDYTIDGDELRMSFVEEGMTITFIGTKA